MKKKITGMLAVILVLSLAMTGCTAGAGTDKKDKLQIVCTIFPQYDWVRQLLGEVTEKVDITLLLDNGTDLHSYQPGAEDIITLSSCDLLVYIGGESDAWVEEVVAQNLSENRVEVNLMQVLGDAVKEEELVEGMQEEEHEHEGEAEHAEEPHENETDHFGEDHEHGGEVEYDEHIWLSVKNAMTCCKYLSEQLRKLLPEYEAEIRRNAESYLEQLAKLDEDYKNTVEAATHKALIFGDRFPFRYLTDDYSIEYYAAFPGCSAESEASFETIVFLAGKVDELDVDSVLAIEGSNQKIAETIIQNTGRKDQTVLMLNSIQSVTAEDINNGTGYLSIMQENLEVLKQVMK